MKFKVPYSFYDNVMTSGRVQSRITEIAGTINANGCIGHLIYTTDKVTRMRPEDLRSLESGSDSDKIININPPFNIGDEVIYQYNSYGANCTPLQKGNVEEIDFSIFTGGGVFWYRVGGKKVDRQNIYKTKEEFIRRTSPKANLREDERYFFTNYCIQQNNLVPKKIIERTQSHTIIEHEGRIRNEFLFTSKEKFYNKMFANI